LADRIPLDLRDPGTVLPLVLIAAFAVRAAWLSVPPGALIFDEAYYVNAARIILGWSVDPSAPYAGAQVGLDPNTEHPPLGKLLMALSMTVLGDNGLGWRLPSLIAGMTAIGGVYLIVRSAGESAWLGILAVSFFAFDNLSLVHSRIGTLDMMALAPILLGGWLALRERWALAGVLMAVGVLIKLTALYGFLALLILLTLKVGSAWWHDRQIDWKSLRQAAVLIVAFSAVAIGGLWLLDMQVTTFATPLEHLRRMVEYGGNLREPTSTGGICTAITSAPWQWPFNECQINYLRVDVNVSTGNDVTSNVPSIDFRGALNPLLAGAIPLAAICTCWFAWRTGNLLARWAVAWAAASYLPYLALAILTDRVMYIYYFLPVVPAVAVAIAILLLRSGLPPVARWGYVVAFAVGFAAYFPFRQIP
jgi:dolichyl-phosphate-mannose--protein O-mannosyl transferase